MSVYNSARLLRLKLILQDISEIIPNITDPDQLTECQSDYQRALSELQQLTDSLGTIPFDDETVLLLTEPQLDVPPRVFTLSELETCYNGKHNHPAYIAINGYVFDVTHSIAFHHSPHQNIPAGHDLSAIFNRYYGGNLVELAKVAPIVGRLIK